MARYFRAFASLTGDYSRVTLNKRQLRLFRKAGKVINLMTHDRRLKAVEYVLFTHIHVRLIKEQARDVITFLRVSEFAPAIEFVSAEHASRRTDHAFTLRCVDMCSIVVALQRDAAVIGRLNLDLPQANHEQTANGAN